MMGEQFSLKPRPFGAPAGVVVEAHGITTTDGRKSRSIAFKEVDAVYSAAVGFGAVLSFVGRDGRKVELAGTFLPFAPNGQAGMQAYFRASSAALKAYAAACPGAEVHTGQSLHENRKTMAVVLVAVLAIGVMKILQDGRVAPAEYVLIPGMLAVVAYVGMTRFNVLKPPP